MTDNPICCDIAALPGRAHVAGVFWWNHRTVRSLFRGRHGAPIFCRGYDEAIEAAQQDGGYVVGWASRLTDAHAEACDSRGIRLVRIEDGFLRSIGLGAGFVSAASLAVDARGIYYDATRTSDIEHALQTASLTDAQRRLGGDIRRRLVAARLSKYNLRHDAAPARPQGRPVVLVVGQVCDDASIKLCRSATLDLASGENANIQLLRAARTRNPDACILFKPHPDVVADLRSGAVPLDEIRRHADLVATRADIVELLEICDSVETISSLAGFEALLRGKSVTVHGTPFYAGWGLTRDLCPLPRRTTRRSVDELAYIALAQYTRHVDPASGVPCGTHQLIDALERLRDSRTHRVRIGALKWAAWACEHMHLSAS